MEKKKMLQVRWGTEWYDLPDQDYGRNPNGIYRYIDIKEPLIPSDAHSIEVFAVKTSEDSPTGTQAFIGYKIENGNFCFIGVPFTEPLQDCIKNPPPIGEEVIFYNKEWVNEDFNPRGIRIGFRTDDDYITAHWWDYQDTYVTISHSDCDDNEEFSESIRKNIDPTHWKEII